MFIYKADLAGTLMNKDYREDANSLVGKFVEALSKTGTSELHVARRYGRMLQRMWKRRESRLSGDRPALQQGVRQYTNASQPPLHGSSNSNPTWTTGLQDQQERPDPENTAGLDHGNSVASLEFPTPQLADPDIGLIDLQALEAFSTQDFSDMLDPFQMAAMDQHVDGPSQGFMGYQGWM